MSGVIVTGRDITLDLGKGRGLSLDPYIHWCIASPALTARAEYRSGNKITFLWYCITSQCSRG